MKKSNLIITCALLICSAGFSQNMAKPNKTHLRAVQKNLSADERIKKNTDRAEKDLGLTPDQKAKWEATTKERVLANEPIRLKMEGSTTPQERKEMRQQMKLNNNKFDSTVGTFLTPEQKTKFEAIKKQQHRGKKDHWSHDTTVPSDSTLKRVE